MAVNKKHEFKKKENGKNDTGAPTKYKPEYCQAIVKYFNDAPRWQEIYDSGTEAPQGNTRHLRKIPARMPSFFRFAESIGVHETSLDEWCKEYKEFFDAYLMAKQLQKEWIIEIGNSDLGSTPFLILVAKNVADMKDKIEQDLNVKTFEHFKSEKESFGV